MTPAVYLAGLGKMALIWLHSAAVGAGLAAVGYVAYTAWAWWRWQRG
jgi:uncharacterized membrane protein YebE (DUF533 family)